MMPRRKIFVVQYRYVVRAERSLLEKEYSDLRFMKSIEDLLSLGGFMEASGIKGTHLK